MMLEYTYQYKDDGLILNGDSELPFIDLTGITGLDGGEFRTSERVREGVDGGFIDADFENMRTIVFNGTVYDSPDTIHRYLSQLKQNFAPTKVPYPLHFNLPGLGDCIYLCKSLGVKYDIDNTISHGRVNVQIQLKAEDPTLYSNEVHTESITFSSVALVAGRAYPKAFNYGYGSVNSVSPGTLTLNNNGTKEATALIRVNNIANPRIVHDNTGREIKLTSEIKSPDFLELDLRNRSVKLNGVTGRGNEIIGGSQWFMLVPGANYIRLLGDVTTGNPTMTVIYRDAYR